MNSMSYDLMLTAFPESRDPREVIAELRSASALANLLEITGRSPDRASLLERTPPYRLDHEPIVARLLAINPTLERRDARAAIELRDARWGIVIALHDNAIGVSLSSSLGNTEARWELLGRYVREIARNTGYRAYDNRRGDFWNGKRQLG